MAAMAAHMRGQAQGEAVPQQLEDLAAPHVDSFDYFLGEGMERVVEMLEPVEIEDPVTKQTHRFWFENASVGRPVKEDAGAAAADHRLLPRECREAGLTYRAPFSVDLCWSPAAAPGAPAEPPRRLAKRLGQLPVMVKSRACYLRNLSRAALVAAREESTEFGGYFICNGIERIIRLLIQPRRHYVMALRRGAYHKRGPAFTDMATLVRCVRRDESSVTARCHLLDDGAAVFALTVRRAEYFVPAGVLLKCFLEVSDRELYDKVCAPAAGDAAHAAFVAERAELLLRQAARYGLRTRAAALAFLGSHFRGALGLPARLGDAAAGEALLRSLLFVHLERPADKLALALAMLAKLYALADGRCCEDNPDALTHHEVLLPGHLLLKFLREQLEASLEALRTAIGRDAERAPGAADLADAAYVKKAAERMPDVGQRFEYLLNTGNLVSRGGLDLTQATGFTVVAEKLNYFRYISHFRSVHRGAYFAELRTTAVRKLLPESWGFLCPVHTPDGAPCGLLNHLTAACRAVAAGPADPAAADAALVEVLVSLGMAPAAPALPLPPPPAHLAVQLDGRVVGSVRAGAAPALVAHLRALKAAALAADEDLTPGAAVLEPVGAAEAAVPAHLEVVLAPFKRGGVYPGVFLFTQGARLARPVRQAASGAAELVGTLEQGFLRIRCPDGGAGGSAGARFSHAEFHTSAILSVVASLTPYSDFNQSPRNMYQCQMGKQTMGTPATAAAHRSDNKLYRLHTPQAPVVRTRRHDEYCADEFPSGTNAVVAVLAYTGYDMEDAMILNKSAVERGFAHASLHRTEMVDLRGDRGRDARFAAEPAPRPPPPAAARPRPAGAFGAAYPQVVPSAPGSAAVAALGVAPEGAHRDAAVLDADGLPHVGAAVWPGQQYYCAVDALTGRARGGKLKGEEAAVVEQVAVVGAGRDRGLRQAALKLRFNRNPVVGDKFSSRHGQKGVLSRLYDDVDMPYAEATGVRPDLLINPHAFPSRMTIGMLIESLTGKAGALGGRVVDATPFQACDDPAGAGAGADGGDPTAEFGAALEAAGFARNGGETLISGITGEPFPADVYVGVVYYQRLRHMVSDKFQVRSTGPVNALTRQPIKGRKFGGGIRFGEMERDSLLAHGAAYLLHDRLHACSDYTVQDVCAACGLLVSTSHVPHAAADTAGGRALAAAEPGAARGAPTCRVCGTGRHVERVAMPYVFKYLLSELACMSIAARLDVAR